MFVVKDAVREPLYAIVPYFNPWRWKSREKHTLRALKHFHDAGAVIILVEVAFNRREFTFADSGLHDTMADCEVLGKDHRFRHQYIGLRSKDELWLKENAINVAVSRLPHDWRQVCWLDSDVHFMRPNWVGECIHKLQHYAFLQMFSHARDLGPNYEMLSAIYPHADGTGFVHAWHAGAFGDMPANVQKDMKNIQADLGKLRKDRKKLEQDIEADGYYDGLPGVPRVWPGLAWAATREAWDAVGGLIDFAVWGGGDWHMAHALIEKTESMMLNGLHRNYKKLVNQWYHRCRTHIRQNVGIMEGSIIHHWHGRKVERGYNAKHSLLARIGFDPPRHLKRDFQGLYQLHDDRSTAFVQLRDTMRRIAKERNEDSIDV
jgi:hypothetical protein